jgi:hypothetical protein
MPSLFPETVAGIFFPRNSNFRWISFILVDVIEMRALCRSPSEAQIRPPHRSPHIMTISSSSTGLPPLGGQATTSVLLVSMRAVLGL